MNIFNRDKIDWENFTAKLLWHNVVYHGDEYSGYDIITSEILSWCKNNPEQTYQRGYKPDDEEEYKKFIDDLLHPKYDNISINFDNISEEKFKKLIAELK